MHCFVPIPASVLCINTIVAKAVWKNRSSESATVAPLRVHDMEPAEQLGCQVSPGCGCGCG